MPRKSSKRKKKSRVRDLRPSKNPKGGIWDKEHVLSIKPPNPSPSH
jgi:hypothetical protein